MEKKLSIPKQLGNFIFGNAKAPGLSDLRVFRIGQNQTSKWFVYILLLSALMFGGVRAEGRWVYQEDEISDDEVAYLDEVDLTETLGQIEEEELALQDEESDLPWNLEESNHEEFSAFVEENAKEASREYEESFAFDSSDDFEKEKRYPSMERVPSRSSSLVMSRPKIVESQSERSETPKENLLPKKKIQKRIATKKPGKIAQGSPSKKAPLKQSRKSPPNQGKKFSKSPELVKKKRHKLNPPKEGTTVSRPKQRKRPTERLAQKQD